MLTRIEKGEKPPKGVAPAIILIKPLYPFNLAGVQRAAASFGVDQVWFTDQRIWKDIEGMRRLPREERMRGYHHVHLIGHDRPFDAFDWSKATPVSVEIRDDFERLPQFEHPENPVYIFGPEDGSLGKVETVFSHRHVMIPTRFCLNLAAAVNVVLYDAMVKGVLI